MIVYGDPHYEESISTLITRLLARLKTLRRTDNNAEPSLDELRTLLILAGQLEQAAQDGLPQLVSSEESRRITTQFQNATDFAASAFCAHWWSVCRGEVPHPIRYDLHHDVSGALTSMVHILESIHTPPVRLTGKVPEGFAFYALYPEQYCVATLRWLADHETAMRGSAIVAGIRSIGTTLSAVVTTILKASGWKAHRLTVRPSGHPFAREVDIPRHELHKAEWALVIDEGPGLSGSSMAAVAQAFAGAGIPRNHISFLPGHNNEPGNATSENARSWWSTTPRYVTPLHELRWNGRSLPEKLADLMPALCGTNEPVERIEDFSGGLWRRTVYSDAALWPAVAAPFERPKFRCTLRNGVSILWKFAGMADVSGDMESAAEAAQRQFSARAEAGWTPTPLGIAFGFLATPWIEGVPLKRADADASVLSHIGHYLAHVAGPPLSSTEQNLALQRLRDVLYWNTKEALGEVAAERTHDWAERAAYHLQGNIPPSYGDGRLAPHEWLRTRTGKLLKMDSIGHDSDHTIIGRQSLAWDIAGAMVEWGLDVTTADPLLTALQEAGTPSTHTDVLTFYRMAYAAFRMGQCSLCEGLSSHDPAEQPRLRDAYSYYRMNCRGC
jgi:hypothetical protein